MSSESDGSSPLVEPEAPPEPEPLDLDELFEGVNVNSAGNPTSTPGSTPIEVDEGKMLRDLEQSIARDPKLDLPELPTAGPPKRGSNGKIIKDVWD